MHYINERWLGGMMTNFKTIQISVKKMFDLEKQRDSGAFDLLPKKEVAQKMHELEKLQRNFDGIRTMKRVPDIMFIVDPRKEHNAILEAHSLGIPIVAIVDTNCDPDEVDFVIPGNDDAIRAVKLIAGKMADAVIEAKQGMQMEPESGEEAMVNGEESEEAEDIESMAEVDIPAVMEEVQV